MRRFIILLVAAFCFCGALTGQAKTQVDSPGGQRRQLKARQKVERASWKLQEKNLKRSLKQQRVSKAMRLEQVHQLQRDRRAMLTRQKDERQQLKDQQRVLRDSQKAYR